MKARLARLLACALPHLAILAVMLLVLSPEAKAFWQCQGQACGTSVWMCCCESRISDCGQECGSPSSLGLSVAPDGIQSIGSSTQGCHCTAVTQSAPQSLPSLAAFFAPPVFLVSVVVPVIHFVVPPDVARIKPVESRGPPKVVCFVSPALRGPPCA
ncbi:hypothetical protein EON83_03880 [bacterium]|nr:MAG: hypothetical protein EON83_03880 [bacterium]